MTDYSLKHNRIRCTKGIGYNYICQESWVMIKNEKEQKYVKAEKNISADMDLEI